MHKCALNTQYDHQRIKHLMLYEKMLLRLHALLSLFVQEMTTLSFIQKLCKKIRQTLRDKKTFLKCFLKAFSSKRSYNLFVRKIVDKALPLCSINLSMTKIPKKHTKSIMKSTLCPKVICQIRLYKEDSQKKKKKNRIQESYHLNTYFIAPG